MDKKIVNELLHLLGHKNLFFENTPVFVWNGNFKTAQTLRLSENYTFSDFLEERKDREVIIIPSPDGQIIDEKNKIRFCEV